MGEAEWRDRGVGTSVVRQFIAEKVFMLPGVETCIIDPDPANKRAIRSYEKAGFEYVKSYYSEQNKMNVYLMRQERGQR
ncbi:GNAT family N-acetyltransferase [Candidatus Lucifugimonas marina]|uniref:GNAT family N-acetyltransferase n=1 Tax=Candidatus Lucifugimonas marina TaxID=3038979 RepID=UPI00319DA98B